MKTKKEYGIKWQYEVRKLKDLKPYKDNIRIANALKMQTLKESLKSLGSAHFWGININPDKQCYRENLPFSFLNFIGGPFQAVLKSNKCRFDERLPLKEDYDFTIQNLNKYRRVLRINRYFYEAKQSQQAGGCACYRNAETEESQFVELQKKWGSNIVKRDSCADRSHKSIKGRKMEDYNPVIRVPIKGV
jgi:hypothetical protein